MTELLVDWINNEVCLSRRVSSLEDDMENGYLLGELLHVHNQLPNLDRMDIRSTADAKIRNFCTIEPSLRGLGVKFDASMAHKIMCRHPGAVANILYKVKMALGRLAPSNVQPASSSGTLDIKPLSNMPLRLSKPTYDKASYAMFEAKIRELVEKQTDTILKAHLKKFEDEAKRQRERVEKSNAMATNENAQLSGSHRAERRTAALRERAFMQSLEQRGLEIWHENQERSKERQRVKQNVRRKFATTVKDRQEATLQRSRKQVQDGIDDFEARLQLMQEHRGKPRKVQPPGAQGMNETAAKSDAEGAEMKEDLEDSRAVVLEREQRELAMRHQLASLRSRKRENDRLASARERRRRRFITEREEAQVAEYHQRAAEHLQDQLTRQCDNEVELDYSLQLVLRHSNMMKDNRSFRQTQYKMRADVDLEEALKRDNAFLEAARNTYESELVSQHARYTSSIEARAAAQRRRNEVLCGEVVLRAVELALHVVEFRNLARAQIMPCDHPLDMQRKEDVQSIASEQRSAVLAHQSMLSLLPAMQWCDLKRMFVSGLPFLQLVGTAQRETDEFEWGRTTALMLAGSQPAGSGVLSEHGDGAPGNARGDLVLNVVQALSQWDLEAYLRNEYPWDYPSLTERLSRERQTDSSLGSFAETEVKPHLCAGASVLARAGPTRGAPVMRSLLQYCSPYRFLGEVVMETRLVADPLVVAPLKPTVPRLDLCICLGGKSFAGKSEQALLVAERYRLKVIQVEALLSEAVELAQEVQLGRAPLQGAANQGLGGRLDEPPAALARLGQRAMVEMMQGRTVPDDVYASLAVIGVQRVCDENTSALNKAESRPESGSSRPKKSKAARQESKQWMGWILEDFPETVEQAKLFERLLSDIDVDQVTPTRHDRESKLAEATTPIKPASDAVIEGSGIDLYIYIDASTDQVLRRCLGRRTDPETNDAYHLDTNRPPYDLICKERLVTPVDPSNPTSLVSLQVAAHDSNSDKLFDLFSRFGTLRRVDSSGLSSQGVFASLVAVINSLLDERSSNSRDNSDKKTRTSRGNKGTNSQRVGEVQGPQLKSAVGAPTGQDDTIERGPSMPNPIMSPQLGRILQHLWDTMETNFCTNARRVFHAVREERGVLSKHLLDLRVEFQEFLARPDSKQQLLDAFIVSFNSLDEDMRFNDLVKAELHLRCEELRHKLWQDVEQRLRDAQSKLNSVKTDGWLEQRVESIRRNFCFMVQLELDRLVTSSHIMQDFLAAHSGQAPEGFLALLEIEGIELSPADGDSKKDKKKGADKKKQDKSKKGGGGSSSSETRAVVAPNILEVLQPDSGDDSDKKNKKDKKKKDAKKGKGGKEPEEEESAPEPTDYMALAVSRAQEFIASVQPEPAETGETDENDTTQEDNHGDSASIAQLVNEALSVQSALASARVARLQDACDACVCAIKAEGEALHHELHRWIETRIAQEFGMVESVVTAAQDTVEEEVPIRYNWVIEGVTLSINKTQLILAKPAPLPVPKKVLLDRRNFNENQKSRLHEALSAMASAEGVSSATFDKDSALSSGAASFVSVNAVLDMLVRMASTLDDTLPEAWREEVADASRLQKLEEAMDPDETGFVSVDTTEKLLCSPDDFGWSFVEDTTAP